MDERNRRHVNALFVRATAMLEDAHLVAFAGQNSQKGRRAYTLYAKSLYDVGQKLSALAITIDNSLQPRKATSRKR